MIDKSHSTVPLGAPDRTHFHQKGRGPPSIFGKRRVPCVQAGLLSCCLETPAWICAQGSHHALPQSGGEPASTALGGGRSSLSVAVSRKSIAYIRGPHPELQKLWATLCLPQRSAEREGYLQTEVGPLDSGWPSPWCTNLKASRAPWGWGLTPLGVLPLPMRWRMVPPWQTSAELWAGQHRTPLQDSTVSVLSQSLPVCWITGNGQEELAGVKLAAPFPLTRGYGCLFLLQFSSPDGKPWWSSSKHPRQSDWAEQSDARPSTGVSSPGSPVSPCTGLGVCMAGFPFG